MKTRRVKTRGERGQKVMQTTNQRDGSFGLLWTNPDVDVLSFESFFVSLHCWNGFGG